MKKWIAEILEAKKKPVVILSSERYDADADTNKANFEKAMDHLGQAGIKYVVGQGVYKGDREPCFVCLPETEHHCTVLEWLGIQFKQECILTRSKGKVELWNCSTGQPTEIGKDIVQVSQKEAETHDSYTVIDGVLSGKQWYVVK